MNNQEKILFLEKCIFELFSREVTLESSQNLIDDLKLDSLDIVEIQLYYEEKTGNLLPEVTHQLILVEDLLKLMQ